jgi:cephalosporin-C deacetylase
MDQAVTDFWDATRAILNETSVDAALTECPEHTGREYETWNVSLRSYGGQRLRGFYTVPRDAPASGRFPAMLAVPGYGGAKEIPLHVVMHGFAVLTLFPRAQGESIPEWDLPHGANKLTYNVTDRESYYYRAGYMDCVRGVDFLAERDEVDETRIGMWSRSQGGGFTLAAAALDHRLAAAVAEEPFMCNYPVAIDIDTRPYHELRNYVQEHPEERQAMLDTLRYFDTLTLADAIECPILVNIGMADTTCPHDTIMPVFERITAHKSLLVYPDLTHSPCTDFNVHAMNWLKRYLGT